MMMMMYPLHHTSPIRCNPVLPQTANDKRCTVYGTWCMVHSVAPPFAAAAADAAVLVHAASNQSVLIFTQTLLLLLFPYHHGPPATHTHTLTPFLLFPSFNRQAPSIKHEATSHRTVMGG